jgi:hypothetical protein
MIALRRRTREMLPTYDAIVELRAHGHRVRRIAFQSARTSGGALHHFDGRLCTSADLIAMANSLKRGSAVVEQQTHNLQVGGSIPPPATTSIEPSDLHYGSPLHV